VHEEVVPPDVIGVVTGAASGTMGLRPAEPASVAPSGIVPPIREFELVGDTEATEEVPFADDDVQPAAALIPPPSNVDDAVIDVLPLMPEDCEDVAPIVPQAEPSIGLKPPGLISVDPSGMPELAIAPVALEPSVPSGDVAPMPDEVIEVCAAAACHVQTIASKAIDNSRRMETSCADVQQVSQLRPRRPASFCGCA
jgi:hypothetical protein